jgi:hypothetical protein
MQDTGSLDVGCFLDSGPGGFLLLACSHRHQGTGGLSLPCRDTNGHGGTTDI